MSLTPSLVCTVSHFPKLSLEPRGATVMAPPLLCSQTPSTTRWRKRNYKILIWAALYTTHCPQIHCVIDSFFTCRIAKCSFAIRLWLECWFCASLLGCCSLWVCVSACPCCSCACMCVYLCASVFVSEMESVYSLLLSPSLSFGVVRFPRGPCVSQ